MAVRSRQLATCVWCGRTITELELGRRRRYCRQSCRQRAYEQRATVKGTSIAEDAVVLSAEEAANAMDRAFEVRCAAEDVATAVDEGADTAALAALCSDLLQLARDAERLR